MKGWNTAETHDLSTQMLPIPAVAHAEKSVLWCLFNADMHKAQESWL